VPLSEENFKAWGASTTPTLVLIDRTGVVRLYHPGRISYEELAPRVHQVVNP
jgi:thioredoxin-related protein